MIVGEVRLTRIYILITHYRYTATLMLPSLLWWALVLGHLWFKTNSGPGLPFAPRNYGWLLGFSIESKGGLQIPTYLFRSIVTVRQLTVSNYKENAFAFRLQIPPCWRDGREFFTQIQAVISSSVKSSSQLNVSWFVNISNMLRIANSAVIATV